MLNALQLIGGPVVFAVNAWLAPPACREMEGLVVVAVTVGLMTLRPTGNVLSTADAASWIRYVTACAPTAAPAA